MTFQMFGTNHLRDTESELQPSPQSQHVINRCTICNLPKDDKRTGPCCICVANGRAVADGGVDMPLPQGISPSGDIVYSRGRMAGKSPMGGEFVQAALSHGEFYERYKEGVRIAEQLHSDATCPGAGCMQPHSDVRLTVINTSERAGDA